MNDYNGLLDRYNAVGAKAGETERKLNEARQECKQLQQQLAQESNNRLTVTKDNVLLRAQITDMSSAQEPLREEKYYILEFSQVGMDIDSWAAKETRTMSKESLSENDSLQLCSELQKCGEYGNRATQLFEGKNRMLFQERRHRISLIRHVTAIILFNRVFDLFAFGLSRDYSEYFKNIEARFCLNGFSYFMTRIDFVLRNLLTHKNLDPSTSYWTSGHQCPGKGRCSLSFVGHRNSRSGSAHITSKYSG